MQQSNNITSNKVVRTRALSGAGFAECKDALVEANGDILLAVGLLRSRGLAVQIHGDRAKWERRRAEAYKRDKLKAWLGDELYEQLTNPNKKVQTNPESAQNPA